jgi:hypothetical protein
MTEYGQIQDASQSETEQLPAHPRLYDQLGGLAISATTGAVAGWTSFYALPALGAIVGLIASPLALHTCAKRGETLRRDKSGKEIRIGVWAQWLGIGIAYFPGMILASFIFSLAKPPTAEETQSFIQAERQRLMIRHCRDELRASLKDPDSYQEKESFTTKNQAGAHLVTIRYSATNSFGGRLQDLHTCIFKQNKD